MCSSSVLLYQNNLGKTKDPTVKNNGPQILHPKIGLLILDLVPGNFTSSVSLIHTSPQPLRLANKTTTFQISSSTLSILNQRDTRHAPGRTVGTGSNIPCRNTEQSKMVSFRVFLMIQSMQGRFNHDPCKWV